MVEQPTRTLFNQPINDMLGSIDGKTAPAENAGCTHPHKCRDGHGPGSIWFNRLLTIAPLSSHLGSHGQTP